MFLRKNKILFTILLFSVLIINLAIGISAQETVKVGILHALTGPQAPAGLNNADGCLFAIDIINGEYPDIAMELAQTAGLPNLNGAKIEAILANTQGEPEFGAAEAERLITISGVCAIQGAQHSGITKTASIVAERYQTPFITATSTSPALTERGFKYLFRTTPNDKTFAENFMELLKDMNEIKGINIKKIGYISANSEWGVGTGEALAKTAEENGFDMVVQLKWPDGTADLDSEVLTLKRENPDVLFAALTDPDIVLFTDTAKKLDYTPSAFIGFGGGFFTNIGAIGEDSEYYMTRDVFSTDLIEQIPLLGKVTQIFKEKYGKTFDGDSIRSFTAMMVLGDAINRAGSTDKEAIRQALSETDIPADQLIVTWEGVKFDEKGQNILGKGIVRQMLKQEYKTVWPFDVAAEEIVYPMPTWTERE